LSTNGGTLSDSQPESASTLNDRNTKMVTSNNLLIINILSWINIRYK
jgi:hypothetical protein